MTTETPRTDPAAGGRRRWMAWGVGVVAILAAVLAWPGLWRGSPSGTVQGTDFGASATGLTWFEPGERPPAPELAGATLAGERMSLRDLRGNLVVVNVWGSWCAPCREEAPDLARVARETHSQGVRFLGVDTRDNKPAARAFVRTYDIPYPSLFDPDGTLMLAFTGTIPINAVPSTVVITPEGRIAARVIGKITYITLNGLIDDVLAPAADDPRTETGPWP